MLPRNSKVSDEPPGTTHSPKSTNTPTSSSQSLSEGKLSPDSVTDKITSFIGLPNDCGRRSQKIKS